MWQDDSPLTDYTDWFVKEPSGHEPSLCWANTHVVLHWFSTFRTSSNPHVDRLMTQHLLHPVPTEQCVGYVATMFKRTWLSVPCDLPLPTVLICHQRVPIQEEEVKIRSHRNATCLYDWLAWHSSCILFTQDFDNITAACLQVDVESARVEQAFSSLLPLGYDSVIYDDIQLMFIMNLALKTINKYMCVMPAFEEECSSQQFECSDESCLPVGFHCNNITECVDGSDEVNCSHVCTETSCKGCVWPECHCARGFYPCERGGCVPVDTVCDGIFNCADQSDEVHCALICGSGTRPCSDSLLCVSDEYWCDGIQHCLDGSDEQCLPEDCPGFLCNNNQTCIPATWLNDGISDCTESEDETGFIKQNANAQVLCDPGELPCGQFVEHCYSIRDHCIYDTEHTGAMTPCRTGGHLMNCKHFQCSSTHKCPNAYCIPFGRLCDGSIDCPDGSDEMGCNDICDGLFCCQQERVCLSHYQVCNDKIDCLSTADDEKYCSQKMHDLICMSRIDTFENKSLLLFDNYLQPVHQAIHSARCGITKLQNTLLANVQLSISLVDISENFLESIPSLVFQQFQHARFIFLQNNRIHTINAFAFWGIHNLFVLDLANNKLSTLKLDMFDKCKIVNLDLRWNPIFNVEVSLFDLVEVSEHLFPAFDLMCCMLHRAKASPQCHGFESDDICSDQLISPVLNYVIWIVFSLCFLLNVVALGKHYRQGNKSTPLLVHVFTADLVMVLYLCILGASSLSYKGIFYYHKLSWASGVPCQIASVVSFVSQQTSLTILFVAEVQHVCVTAYPLRRIVSPRVCTLVIFFSWSVWVILGWLPHATHYFSVGQISLNSVCLYYDLGQPTPWKALFTGVFVVLNVALSAGILLCCCIIYQVVLRSSKQLNKHKGEYIIKVKQRMLVVSVSNVVGCLPCITVSVLTLCGVSPSELMWAITAVTLIPLFAIINPIVYK